MALFNPSRDQVRDFFFDTWAKFAVSKPLSPLETLALEVMHLHPEYHALLNQPERYKQQSYFPEQGETNPFLHMSLHLAIMEQLSINQPHGIAEIYQILLKKHQDKHLALHDILECLGETIWQAQRNKTGLDNQTYLNLLRSKADLPKPNEHA